MKKTAYWISLFLQVSARKEWRIAFASRLLPVSRWTCLDIRTRFAIHLFFFSIYIYTYIHIYTLTFLEFNFLISKSAKNFIKILFSSFYRIHIDSIFSIYFISGLLFWKFSSPHFHFTFDALLLHNFFTWLLLYVDYFHFIFTSLSLLMHLTICLLHFTSLLFRIIFTFLSNRFTLLHFFPLQVTYTLLLYSFNYIFTSFLIHF